VRSQVRRRMLDGVPATAGLTSDEQCQLAQLLTKALRAQRAQFLHRRAYEQVDNQPHVLAETDRLRKGRGSAGAHAARDTSG
jgi:hypothetical protein